MSHGPYLRIESARQAFCMVRAPSRSRAGPGPAPASTARWLRSALVRCIFSITYQGSVRACCQPVVANGMCLIGRGPGVGLRDHRLKTRMKKSFEYHGSLLRSKTLNGFYSRRWNEAASVKRLTDLWQPFRNKQIQNWYAKKRTFLPLGFAKQNIFSPAQSLGIESALYCENCYVASKSAFKFELARRNRELRVWIKYKRASQHTTLTLTPYSNSP